MKLYDKTSFNDNDIDSNCDCDLVTERLSTTECPRILVQFSWYTNYIKILIEYSVYCPSIKYLYYIA